MVYKDGFDKPSLYVPCNTCEACRVNLQNDWTIRAYFHWKYYQSIGGCTLFITNTYRQNDSDVYGKATVPIRWVYDLGSDNKLHRYFFKCFDKDHIDTYINSVRKYFRRKYGIGKNSSDTSINYLVCCEYGSKNTLAPHYHILFFFPPMPASRSEIKKVCDRLWHRGFSIYSLLSNGGAFVNSVSGIKYVSKYCAKDLNFYGHSVIQKALSKDYSRKNLKRNLPRHWQSQGFGKYMCSWLSELKDPVFALMNGVRMDWSQSFYNVPLYVRNKLLFDIYYLKDNEGNILHTLRKFNEYGYSLAPDIYEYNLKRYTDNLSNDFTMLGLSKYFVDKNDLHDFFAESNTLDLHDNFSYLDVVRSFKSLLGSHSIRDLAIYNMVFRGFTSSDLTKFKHRFKRGRPFDDVSLYSSVAKDVYLDRALDSMKTVYQVPDLKPGSSHHASRYLLEFCEDYQKFETILVTLDLMRQHHSRGIALAKDKREKNKKYVRDQFMYNF